MADREKVIKALETCRKTDCANCEYSTEVCLIDEIISDALALLKEQEKQKFFVDESGKITPLPVVVLCNDCKYYQQSPETVTSFWKPCDEVHTEPNYFCWCGKRKDDKL